MRSRRATAVIITLLVLTGCGVDAGGGAAHAGGGSDDPASSAPTTTSTEPRFAPVVPSGQPSGDAVTSVTGACRTDAEPPNVKARWMAEACPAIVEPTRIMEAEMVPAVRQPDWDWPALYASCHRVDAALDALADELEHAPPEATDVAEELTEYLGETRTFSDVCLEAEPAQDKAPIQAAAPQLFHGSRTISLFVIALTRAMHGN